ncbi:MAG: Hsp33 family molecular chaperone HslO [Mogibacterium sp.]|nr:Hsp33 family molecular chaperone HslO [Mogibacterium sp.]
MNDYIVRGIAAGGTVRAFAADTTETVAYAAEKHETYPVVSAALGRTLTAAAMMGSMMKGEDDLITLTIKGDGPIGNITVTADSKGNVKGFAGNPIVDIPLKGPAKLDVGGAVGNGTLTVVMDLGLSEPYNGMVELQTGEIGDDLAYYFTVSEQTPSAVGLGVMVDTDWSIRHSGGFIVQMMPDVEESTIEAIEDRLANISSVTDMLDRGMSPEDILKEILGDLGLEITEKSPVQFHCNCDKERVSSALATIQTADLQEMIDDGKEIEVKCYFCNSTYDFTVEELQEILNSRLG